jgi:hypothetical protein
MTRRIFLAAFAFGALAILSIQPALGLTVERSVSDSGNGIFTVILQVDNSTAVGITETLPAGLVLSGVSLPSGQVRWKSPRLYLALIGDGVATYQVSGPDSPLGNIHGGWIDIVSGERGEVLELGNSTTPSDMSPGSSAGLPLPEGQEAAPRAGTAGATMCMAALLAVILAAVHRKGGM